ncbi:MAG: sodium:solute symporter [Planctomycetota bacterium]
MAIPPLQTDAAAAASSSPVFWSILLGYLILVLGFGSWFARFNRTTSDFFYGGRRFAWWLITMSIVATGVGSHSFLKYSGISFENGFSGTMAYMNDWFFMPLFLFGWLPILYFMRIRSIPEYFERRFHPAVRVLATVGILGFLVGYIGIGFLTMAKTLQPILGWDLGTIVWVVAAVAGIYITIGGQTAVIFTDLFQGFLLLAAGLALFLLGLDWLGGWDVFWKVLPREFKLPLADFNRPSSFNFVGVFWQDAIAGSIGFLFMNQGLIMRFLACRSLHEGRKAAAVNVLVVLPVAALAVCGAGWIGKAVALTHPEVIAAATPPDEIFVRVAGVVSSPAGFGFFVAAVAAALMSTVDTLINAVAAVTLNDVYQKLVPGRRDRHYLGVARGVSVLATLAGVLAALFFSRFRNLYQAHGFFLATMTPPLVTATFLGIFWKRFNTPAAVATLAGGALLIVLGRLFPLALITPFAHGIAPDNDPPFVFIQSLYNLAACFAVGVTVTLLTRPGNPEKIAGLTLGSLDTARRRFKGGEPNDRPGGRVRLAWRLDPELAEGAVVVDAAAREALAADPGDLVYLSDPRWWLGGLRSTHARLALGTRTPGRIRLAPTWPSRDIFSHKSR